MKKYRRFIRIGDELVGSPRFKTKKDSDHWYAEMKRKAQFQKHNVPFVSQLHSEMDFLEVAAEFINKRKGVYPEATVMADEGRIRLHLLPHLQTTCLKDITKESAEKILNSLKIGPSTRRRVKVVFSQVMDLGVDKGVISANPVKSVKLKDSRKVGITVDRKDVLFTAGEVKRYLAAARSVGDNAYLLAALGVMAGLRKSEIIALRWENVDLRRGIIFVCEKLEQVTGKVLNATKKGENSVEPVPIPASLVEILRECKSRTKSEFVLSDKKGAHFNAFTLRAIHAATVAKYGRVITIHGLRHTYGTHLAANKVDPFSIKKLMRHSSLETTQIYVHLTEDRLKRDVEKIDFLTP